MCAEPANTRHSARPSAYMRWAIALLLLCGTPHARAQTTPDSLSDAQTTERRFPLPEALQRSEDNVLPRVLGPVELRADARGKIPPQPKDIEELLIRYFPTWTWVKTPATVQLSDASRGHTHPWQPEAGACYVAIGFDHSLSSFQARQKEQDGKLPWWEAGADIDIQIRDAQTKELIAEDLSREILAMVQWCSDGRPVTIEVRLGVPEDVSDTVDVSWGVAVDPSTLAPLRFTGRDALTQRLKWAQSIVTPRGEARSAPAVFEAHGPTLMYAHVRPPAQGCDVLIAIGEAGIQDLSLAHDDARMLPHDFSDYPLAAVPICAAKDGEESTHEVLVGIRAGKGRVALQRFGFPR